MLKKLSRRQFLRFGSGVIISSAIVAETSNTAKGQNAPMACFWSNEQAFMELRFIYALLLGRDLDSDGQAHYTSLLQPRDYPWSLKEIVADK